MFENAPAPKPTEQKAIPKVSLFVKRFVNFVLET